MSKSAVGYPSGKKGTKTKIKSFAKKQPIKAIDHLRRLILRFCELDFELFISAYKLCNK